MLAGQHWVVFQSHSDDIHKAKFFSRLDLYLNRPHLATAIGYHGLFEFLPADYFILWLLFSWFHAMQHHRTINRIDYILYTVVNDKLKGNTNYTFTG